jgi:hypothetical protein
MGLPLSRQSPSKMTKIFSDLKRNIDAAHCAEAADPRVSHEASG